MSISISHSTGIIKGEIKLTSSKSLSNRVLIIQGLCNDAFDICNLSESNDTDVLQQLINSSESELDVNLSGTAMRFLTAFLAIKSGEFVITGAGRMKERPIKELVDSLIELGANIEYLEKVGFPPLKIIGQDLKGGKVEIDGSISSQYISALLMIAVKLKSGIQIDFLGEVISKPYINMTVEVMRFYGAFVHWKGNSLLVDHGDYKGKNFIVEADWSAASYWYSMVALSKGADVILLGLKRESLQGDAIIQEIYTNFGVITEYVNGGIRLTKNSEFRIQNSEMELDFTNCPDIAQTVAVTCAALNIKAKLIGLKTLRIKETDRISALQIELTKLGFSLDVEDDDILINSIIRNSDNAKLNTIVETYDDHRMAMAFAPLALIKPITIQSETVVGKSYPNFWKDLEEFSFLFS